MAFAYLIRLPNRKAHERAIAAFLRVPHPRQVFTGRRMLVTQEHMDVLRQEGIPFTDISDSTGENGEKRVGKAKAL